VYACKYILYACKYILLYSNVSYILIFLVCVCACFCVRSSVCVYTYIHERTLVRQHILGVCAYVSVHVV